MDFGCIKTQYQSLYCICILYPILFYTHIASSNCTTFHHVWNDASVTFFSHIKCKDVFFFSLSFLVLVLFNNASLLLGDMKRANLERGGWNCYGFCVVWILFVLLIRLKGESINFRLSTRVYPCNMPTNITTQTQNSAYTCINTWNGRCRLCVCCACKIKAAFTKNPL